MADASIDALRSQFQSRLAAAASARDLKAIDDEFLSRKSGSVTALMQTLKSLPADERRAFGAAVNTLKTEIETALAERKAAVEASRPPAGAVDVTLPGRDHTAGRVHPLMRVRQDVEDIFIRMGYEILEGPEVEDDFHNFEALNMPPDHPARDMQDTFFVEPPEAHLLMRTHTSPVQVRSMLERELPIYVLCPGKVFRTDELDATHTPVFHQFEGLAIDKKLSMADLRGTLEHFARQMFGDEAQIRLRPNYFPFTEPSAELDIWHPGAKGGPSWIEWGGCGMVNPNVLRAAGIDPDIYSGFAFGMGIERTLMFRNEVGDMRDMIEGDVRFSEHFGMEI